MNEYTEATKEISWTVVTHYLPKCFVASPV